MIEVEINQPELNRVLRNLQLSGKAVGLTLQHLIWEVAALASADAVKYTPPRSESVGSFSTQRKIGEKAIAGDLERLFADEENWIVFQAGSKSMARAPDKRAAFEINRVTNLESVHMANRNRKGRVPRPARQYFVPKGTLKPYTRTVQSRVGELKAGWLDGLDKFNALAMRTSNVPSWIRRHSGGGFAVNAVTSTGGGYARSENLVRHRSAIRGDMIRFIQTKRQRDVEKYLPRRLERIAARFNAGVSSGRKET